MDSKILPKNGNIDEWLKSIESEMSWWDRTTLPIHRNILNPLRDFYYNLINFPRNLKVWLPFVWTYRNFDYGYSLEALQISLTEQVKCFKSSKEHGMASVDVDTIIKDIEIVVCIIKRIREDDYFNAEYDRLYEVNPSRAFTYHENRRKQDKELLFKKLKKVEQWWD
jgi:hypothetical protein